MIASVSELVRLFLDWTTANRSAGTVGAYQRHLDRFAEHVEGVPIEHLKAHHLMTWATTWHKIQAVQRLFSWAKNDAELLESNPFARVKKPARRGRRRILSRAELVKLFRVVAGDFRLLLFTCRESLCRPQEVRALTWEEIQHDETCPSLDAALLAGRAFWRLTEFKARARRKDPHATRIIPISPRLGRLLLRLKRVAPDLLGTIFVTARGVAWCKEKIRNRMRTARKRAGFKRDRAGEQVCLYTLRHTMATHACAKGIRDRVLADLLGHSTTRTTARYQHLQVPHLLDAMSAIHRR